MPITTNVVSSIPVHGKVHVLDTTLCDKVCQLLATDRYFSPGILVSSTNETDRHNIAEILLKVALNTIALTPVFLIFQIGYIMRVGPIICWRSTLQS